MKIRKVTVELLRAGPRHNQLLSPLTQYLGICGNAPAGLVRMPFEHREVEYRLAELGYRVAGSTDASRRAYVLDDTAREMAGILAQIPSLPGQLNADGVPSDTLTHLRIVLSASELAMLPFELAKTPTGAEPSAEWLALQARMPVCITRHIRSAGDERTRWPTTPRILMIAGPETPAREHEEALRRVLDPWRGADGSIDRWLVVLKEATRADVEREVERSVADGMPFTHVHILAHGEPLRDDPASPIGVALVGETLSGERLATVLTDFSSGGASLPAVVTLATCDSGKVPDVRATVASVAHDLHDHGIPLVVASQFPLTVRGSIPFVERFYAGQLAGDHPLVSLYQVRLMLHRQFGHETHDWASLVVYEALPSNFEQQLEALTYWQRRRQQNAALDRLEARVRAHIDGRAVLAQQAYRALVDEATAALQQLPEGGAYALECQGLRAAGHKRLAQTAIEIALKLDASDPWRTSLVDEYVREMDRARTAYWNATRAYLAPASDGMRTKANLHWLLGQVLSLDAILGRDVDRTAWTAARMAAQIDTDSGDPVERAWGYVSLAEQALLRLDDASPAPAERSRHAAEALEHAHRIVELLGRGSEHVFTTSRQFERYATVWGNPRLAELGLDTHPHWHVEHGLVPTALEVVRVLRGRRGTPPTGAPATEASGAVRSSAVKAQAGGATSAGEQGAEAQRASGSRRRAGRVFSIEMLPVENGDCLWIEYGDACEPNVLLIDCGSKPTAAKLAQRIADRRHPLDLFVLTHVDADHITGVLPLFEQHVLDGKVADVWFNGWKQLEGFLSVQQGEAFSKMLGDPTRGLPWNRALTAEDAPHPAPVYVPEDGPLPTFELEGGMRLTLLSPGPDEMRALGLHWKSVLDELEVPEPTLARRKRPPPVDDFERFELEPLAQAPVRKDPSTANGSSIAFLAEFDGRSLLLTGDAHAGVLQHSLDRLMRERGREGQRLAVDAIKLSHHGSMHGTTLSLLERLDCPRYLVSTSGKIFYHPDREAIARVVLHGGSKPTLCFNYRSELNALWDERTLRERYRYKAVYPKGEGAGLRVDL